MITEEQLDLIQQVIEGVREDDSALNDWEREFMKSVTERVEKYGQKTYMSEKQMAVVQRVYDKLMGVPEDTASRFGRR